MAPRPKLPSLAANGQLEADLGAPSLHIPGEDAAAMRLDDAAHDGEAETVAAPGAGPRTRRVAADEGLERPLGEPRREARAAVAHGHSDAGAAGGACDADLERRPGGVTVGRSVDEQVVDHAAEERGVEG